MSNSTNIDLLYTQIKQDPTLSDWVRLTSYSVDNLTEQGAFNALRLELKVGNVEGRYSLAPARTSVDESSFLEVLNYRNKFDIPGADPIELRTMYLRDRDQPISVWDDIVVGNQSDAENPNYSDFVKITITDAQVMARTDPTINAFVGDVEVYIPLPIKEGEIFYEAEEDLTGYNVDISFHLEYTAPGEITTTVFNGNFELTNKTIEQSLDQAQRQGYAYVVVTGLPLGKYTVELFRSNDLKSKTGYQVTESYLPAETFSLADEQEVNLESIAYSILPLAHLGRIDLINGIIDRLTYYLSEFNYFTLPDSVYRNKISTTSNQVSITAIALLVAHLSMVAKDTSLQRIRVAITEFSNVIINSFNLASQRIIETYTVDQTPINVDSLESTIISYMALNNSLSLFYERRAHYVAARLELEIKDFTQSVDNLTTVLEDLSMSDRRRILSWLVIWAHMYKETDSLNVITAVFKTYHELNPTTLSTKDNLIVAIAVSILVDKGLATEVELNLANWASETFISQVEGDLYTGIADLDNQMLLYSSLRYVNNNKLYKELDGTFYTYAVETVALKTYMTQKCINLMPTGEQWFREESLRPGVGLTGSILNAYNEGLFPLLLQYFTLAKGFNIKEAQGAALDLWGTYFDLKRGRNQDDNDYRTSLNALAELKGNSLNAIKESIKTIDENILVETLIPNPILVDNVLTTWSSLTEFIEYAEVNNPAGVYDEDGNFIALTDCLGVVYITFRQTSNVLSQVVEKLKPLGVQIRYTRYKTYIANSNHRSATNYAGVYNYS